MHSALNLKRQFLLNHVNTTFFFIILLSKDPTFSQLTEKQNYLIFSLLLGLWKQNNAHRRAKALSNSFASSRIIKSYKQWPQLTSLHSAKGRIWKGYTQSHGVV